MRKDSVFVFVIFESEGPNNQSKSKTINAEKSISHVGEF
jgi:hypothetical protein